MEWMKRSISNYQELISAYENQLWENAWENVIRNRKSVKRKRAKVDPNLIDVDLVRGSTFTSSKSRQNLVTTIQNAILRVVFLPAYYQWWMQCTSLTVFWLISSLYVFQLTSLVLCVSNAEYSSLGLESPWITHSIGPCLVMLAIAFIQTEIVDNNQSSPPPPSPLASSASSTSSSFSLHVSKRKRNGKVAEDREDFCSGSDQGSTESHDTGIDLRPDDTVNDVGSYQRHSLIDRKMSSSERLQIATDNTMCIDSNEISTVVDDSGTGLPYEVVDSCEDTSEEFLLFDRDSIMIPSNSQRRLSFEKTSEWLRRQNAESSEGFSPDFTEKDEAAGEVASTFTDSGSEFSENDSAAGQEDNWPDDKSAILNHLVSENSKVGCVIWEMEEIHKVDLTGFEICSRLMQEVKHAPESSDDIFLGVALAFMLMSTPVAHRIYCFRDELSPLDDISVSHIFANFELAAGDSWSETFLVINDIVLRLFTGLFLLFLLSVAERTFRQRLVYAKNFCSITSSHRAKKYDLPHFRLSKVRNVKTWLSIRSFLKSRGCQRSIETVVTSILVVTVVIASVISIQLLRDSEGFWEHLVYWDLVVWCVALGIFLAKFFNLNLKINQKYCDSSILITEQINLFLRMERKRERKEELMMVNNVVRLSEQLLKELEGSFKVMSCFSANPLLYNLTKLFVLSAVSAVWTQLFGFKVKLYNINLRS